MGRYVKIKGEYRVSDKITGLFKQENNPLALEKKNSSI